RSKSKGVSNIANPVIKVIENLADRHQPYKRFKKAKKRGCNPPATKNINDADCIDRYVRDAGHEDQQWQKNVTVNLFTYSERACKKFFHEANERISRLIFNQSTEKGAFTYPNSSSKTSVSRANERT